MRMKVFHFTGTFFIANRIFNGTRPVIYTMYKTVRQKKRHCTEYRRFINSIQTILQIKQRKRPVRLQHSL